MADLQLNRITRIIRIAAYSKQLTVPQLSKRLDVSEPTIKRWLRGEGINLHQWTQLMAAVGLRLSDVAAALDEPFDYQFEYTEKQERMLSEAPGLLAFFQALQSGREINQIANEHDLTKTSVAFYLKQLDAIGLIEWTEGLTARLKIEGEPKWKKQGPLVKKYRMKLFNDFIGTSINNPALRLGHYELTKKDKLELEQRLSEVYDHAAKSEKKARLLKLKTESTCLGTCLDLHAPDFLYKIPNIQSK